MDKPFFVIFLLLLLIILDIYTFQAFKTLLKKNEFLYMYWLFNIIILAIITFLLFTISVNPKDTYKVQTLLGLLVVFYLPKLFLIIPLLLEDILRFFSWLTSKITSLSNFYPSRRKAISILGLGIAAIPFLSSIYGIFKGRFNYKLHKFSLEIDNLPENFNRYKIVQISDIHVGSFSENQKDEILKGIKIINNQKADIILFTGDLVNFVAEEILPFLDVFSQIKGEYKYATIGNHDYGQYFYNRQDESYNKNIRQNIEKLVEFQKKMGFINLRNKSVRINKGNDFINIIGVENWGKKGRFPQTGDLEKATQTIQNGEINILMSHDPTHFDKIIKNFHKHIHLTLSGHTHGMQMGVDIPFLKFSPAQFMYKKWAGLYEDMGRFLYVNRGFGFIALPARIGIFPEITLIELKRKV